jgi:23S rRNA pseudouridine955/2504/2580 synthase
MIGENEAGQRTDRFLRKYLSGAPLSAIYRIIRKDLKVNGKRVREDTQLSAGDELTLYLSQEQLDAYAAKARRRAPAKKQFRVIYEDAQVLIVSKPAGLLVHGDQTEKRNTLINQVCGYLQDKGEYDPSRETTFTPSPANRIDRNTSGLVIFGKTAPALRELTRLIRMRDGIRKFYLAVAAGQITEEMVLTDRLMKDTVKNKVSASDNPALPGQAAQTHVRPVETGERFSLVEAELITGRTHQIRVHLAEAGHPLAGDPKYGDPRVNEICKKKHITSQLLHAWRLQFSQMDQPLQELSGKTIEAEPPKAFRQAAEELIHGGI